MIRPCQPEAITVVVDQRVGGSIGGGYGFNIEAVIKVRAAAYAAE